MITKEKITEYFTNINEKDFKRLILDYYNNYKGYEFFKITNNFKISNKYNKLVQKFTFYERSKTLIDNYKYSLNDYLNQWKNIEYLNSLNMSLENIISNFRRGAFLECKIASNFPTTIARDIYENFLNGNENTVLDFCAGWGDRLLAAKTCKKIKINIINDINTNLVTQYKKLAYEIDKHLNKLNNLDLFFSKPAEEWLKQLPKNSVDLIFTSPPYFNREKYENGYNVSQSYIRHNKFERWLNNFLKIIIFESYRLLKNKRYFILNIKDLKNPNYNLIEYTIKFAEKAGFILKEIIDIPIKTTGTEPLLIFWKEKK